HSRACSHSLVLEYVRSLAVDEELELLAGNEAADAEVLDRKLVFAIGGEVVAHKHAAASPERQTLEMLILRCVARRKISSLSRRFPIADSHAGDPRRCRCIGLEERRRNRQRTGDVVETPGRIVWR